MTAPISPNRVRLVLNRPYSVMPRTRPCCSSDRPAPNQIASGPAIEKRLGATGAVIPETDSFWEIEADYMASALMNYILTLSPKKIILGGGVMQRDFLFPKVHRRVRELLNSYVSSKTVSENIENYIQPPGLGNQSGSLGAIALAMQMEARNNDPRI